MINTIAQYMTALPSSHAESALTPVLTALGDRLSSQTINTAALRIKGGAASAIVQTNAASVYVANGKLVIKASATDLPALVGTVTNATFNVFAFFVNSAGTLSTSMGIAGSTLAKVQFPPIPERSAMIGFIIIVPTGTGNFVGGTTALDDGTVVPNVVFCNTIGAFDPSVILS
jgi:hypothetical protein